MEAGELEHYRTRAVEPTQPIAKMLAKGIKVAVGTDATASGLLQPVGFPRLARDRQDGLRTATLSAAELLRSRDCSADMDGERHLVL